MQEKLMVETFKLLHELPPPHYRTAKLLFRHLNALSQQEARTSMPAKNLAICWAPNLLKNRRFDTPEHLLASIGALLSTGLSAPHSPLVDSPRD